MATSIFKYLQEPSWRTALWPAFSLMQPYVETPYVQTIDNNLTAAYAAANAAGKEIFPQQDHIFNAFRLTPIDKVKAVIIGQDPYHGVARIVNNIGGQISEIYVCKAMGLSFSVPLGFDIPPSLKNIYTELEEDPLILGFKRPNHGCLEKWAKEGVLMLNAILTVEAGTAGSHASIGWETFTDHVIQIVSKQCPNAVFILMGEYAHKKAMLRDPNNVNAMLLDPNKVILTAHPSPLSNYLFKGCKCFSECNKKLKASGVLPIDWGLYNIA